MKARRGWAWPLVPLYAAGLAVKDGLRAAGMLRTRRLEWPVVSVGSLSAGGAGKTPVVIALAELLRRREWNVDVLSRGFGRGGRGVERVSAHGDSAAAQFGDEPVLIARRTRVPVWVGADRFDAGSAAEAGGDGMNSARSLHLLDDGFQHRALARTLDIVLVTAEDLKDALLPAGNRRERLRALGRADVVVVREQERATVEARVRKFMRADAALWSMRRELRFTDSLQELAAGPRPVAFCGIARPSGFWTMLAQAGCKVVAEVAFNDHHAYSTSDVERLVGIAKQHEGTGFLTTEKDRVKLPKRLLDMLRAVGPVSVVRLEAKFLDEEDVIGELEARLA